MRRRKPKVALIVSIVAEMIDVRIAVEIDLRTVLIGGTTIAVATMTLDVIVGTVEIAMTEDQEETTDGGTTDIVVALGVQIEVLIGDVMIATNFTEIY